MVEAILTMYFADAPDVLDQITKHYILLKTLLGHINIKV